MHFVGNVMIDTLIACQPRIADSGILDSLDVGPRQYAVLTMHRPANVDRPEVLAGLMRAVDRLQCEIPFVFPIHPRTRAAVERAPYLRLPNLIFTEPLGYLDFMKLIGSARFVLTDSGGVQEECAALGKPVLVMRSLTERAEAVDAGVAVIVGTDADQIVAAGSSILLDADRYARMSRPSDAFGDGKASERILEALLSRAP
jgi:UDP-N-acetylglucosamine 2-epimerase (non-hydrolysing)